MFQFCWRPRYGHEERVGCLADMDKRTVEFYREGADGRMNRLAGCVVGGIPDGVHIVATPASEGSTATLSFPVDPVLSRLDDLDAVASRRSKVCQTHHYPSQGHNDFVCGCRD